MEGVNIWSFEVEKVNGYVIGDARSPGFVIGDYELGFDTTAFPWTENFSRLRECITIHGHT